MIVTLFFSILVFRALALLPCVRLMAKALFIFAFSSARRLIFLSQCGLELSFLIFIVFVLSLHDHSEFRSPHATDMFRTVLQNTSRASRLVAPSVRAGLVRVYVLLRGGVWVSGCVLVCGVCQTRLVLHVLWLPLSVLVWCVLVS